MEFVDWNKKSLDELTNYLYDKYCYQSTGEAKAIFELINYYRRNKLILDHSMDLGSTIKEAIKSKGLTQKEVSKKIGISQNALSQICINSSLPSKLTLSKICELLQVEIRYIVVGNAV